MSVAPALPGTSVKISECPCVCGHMCDGRKGQMRGWGARALMHTTHASLRAGRQRGEQRREGEAERQRQRGRERHTHTRTENCRSALSQPSNTAKARQPGRRTPSHTDRTKNATHRGQVSRLYRHVMRGVAFVRWKRLAHGRGWKGAASWDPPPCSCEKTTPTADRWQPT